MWVFCLGAVGALVVVTKIWLEIRHREEAIWLSKGTWRKRETSGSIPQYWYTPCVKIDRWQHWRHILVCIDAEYNHKDYDLLTVSILAVIGREIWWMVIFGIYIPWKRSSPAFSIQPQCHTNSIEIPMHMYQTHVVSYHAHTIPSKIACIYYWHWYVIPSQSCIHYHDSIHCT